MIFLFMIVPLQIQAIGWGKFFLYAFVELWLQTLS